MSDIPKRLITGLVAFGGGFLAGILLAPNSGEETRGRIADEAKDQFKRLDKQIHGLEAQLSALQDQLSSVSTDVGERFRSAAHKGVEKVIPELPDDPDSWKVEDDEVASELRHMPRK